MSATPVYIAGVSETALGEVYDQSEHSMVALAAREALAEAGLTLGDVDAIGAVYLGELSTVEVGEYLGIKPRFVDSTNIGGASFEAMVHHLMLAIAAGRCEVGIIAYASRQRTKRTRRRAAAVTGDTLHGQFHAPYGLPRPIGDFALVAARHMAMYGTTSEQLAEIAVAARKWAQLNPKAFVRHPLTVDDVLNSPMLCDPLHKLDCCLVTDGGGVVVITNAEHARNAAKRPIRVIGAGESHSHLSLTQMEDLTVSAGVVSAREAFAMAGIGPDDVDVFEPYDAFTIAALMQFEDVGFCAKGEGGAFVSGGRIAPGGALPSMTAGGGLSYNHPGVYGLLLLVEAVRQLRHEAGARQVPDARIAVCHGLGGLFSASSTVVLARD